MIFIKKIMNELTCKERLNEEGITIKSWEQYFDKNDVINVLDDLNHEEDIENIMGDYKISDIDDMIINDYKKDVLFLESQEGSIVQSHSFNIHYNNNVLYNVNSTELYKLSKQIMHIIILRAALSDIKSLYTIDMLNSYDNDYKKQILNYYYNLNKCKFYY